MNEKKLISAHTETNPSLMKNFLRTYYGERYKTLSLAMLVIAIVLFFAAAAIYYNGFGLMWAAICVWIGAVMIIYPRNAYRKPYKKMKNTRVTTYFDFYENSMTERSGGKLENYKYSEIYKTLETNQYFYIFHSPENVSILEKKDISLGSADELRLLLKSKTDYKLRK